MLKNYFAALSLLAIALLAATTPALAGTAIVATPEPGSALLIGGGLGALILVARWKRSQKK